ncbi:MAG: isoprenyl transferase [Bacteroidales bacterium]|nr:isoprenyl transferase [Candidatus Sodaliphilus aphodohippi]
MSFIDKIDKNRLPEHVAIIMDGNGRWAKEKGHERTFGHQNGVTAVRNITETASNLGIKYLTLYTFSTENWNRPQAEVDMLMNLIVVSIEQQTPDLLKHNIRLTTIGNMERLPQFARERLTKCMRDTEHCTGLVMCLAISYSARWEIVEACRKLAVKVQEGALSPDDINDESISASLTTSDMPDPDLLIRTGGDIRISNYLLWQIAYSELYFTDKYWPDFDAEEFYRAIVEYQNRERRYGKTSEQVNNENND